jgi:hypothetical protein
VTYVRRSLLAAALLALALPLGGCVKITSQTAVQQQTIGDMRLTTKFCLTYGQSCPTGDTNSDRPVQQDHTRLLLGYRVPQAVVGPATISVSSTDPPGTLTLTPSASYTSELQRLSAAPSGKKWLGYISADVPVESQVPDSTHTATADFKLGRGADGSPFVGPFEYRVYIGARGTTTAGAPASTTVDCGQSLTAWNANESSICSDSPKAPSLPWGGSPATKDVGVLNGADVAAEQGQAVSVPFTVKSAGSALPIVNLSAGTTAPGATATSSLAQIQPNGGSQSVPVSVSVASNTPVGTYDVTLTATTTNGQQLRIGTRKLFVSAPPPSGGGDPPPSGGGDPPPTTGDAVPPKVGFVAGARPKLGKALKKGLRFTVVCDEGCSAVVTLRKRGGVATKLGSGKGDKLAAGQFGVTAHFTKKARKKYAKARSLKLSAVLEVKDATGNHAAPRKLKITLKR